MKRSVGPHSAENAGGPPGGSNAARQLPSETLPSALDENRRHAMRRRRIGPRTDLTRVKGILAKALAFRGLDKKVERYEFILHWREIVGERFAEVSKPEYISRRTLLVTVSHSAWAQEMAFVKPVLLQKLAKHLKRGDSVGDMAFRVGTIA